MSSVSHTMSAAQRELIGVGVAIVVGLVAALLTPWQIAPLIGWIAGGLWYLISVWVTVGHLTPQQTHELSTREDDSRFAAELLLVAASLASLVGTALALEKANQATGTEKGIVSVAAVATVIVSWAMVHTTFALRYTRLYYGEPPGGIDFKNADEPPDYRDFAYVAFTVGMTFQISDTDIQSRVIRRTVLRHALISYLFGAVILAVAINTVAALAFR